jgi:fumarate hydratase subunit beta
LEKLLSTPISDSVRKSLKVGDEVLISGIIYTARDAAHKNLVNALKNSEKLPFDLVGQVVYYVGPTPARPNQAIGSCGPTSSYRMDTFSPILMSEGLKVMIGKGERSTELVNEVKRQQGVYLMAIGGIGALLSKTVRKSEVIAYPELGAEAIRKLEVENFPAIVAIDSQGNSIFQ